MIVGREMRADMWYQDVEQEEQVAAYLYPDTSQQQQKRHSPKSERRHRVGIARFAKRSYQHHLG